jgi:hypothetical protein
MLGGIVHTITKNTEDLVVAGKGIGLEVNADKTKQMVMFRQQNAGQNRNIQTENKPFERVEHFRYLGTNLADQNSIQKKLRPD